MQDMTNEAGTGEQDVSQLTTTVLAARLPAASPWMPRREMEELLRRGPDAAPPLIDVLRRAQGRGDPLWPIVVLGELHRDDAIPALGLFLGRLEGGVNVAAAEALGKIGPPALPYLVATVAGEDRGRRLAAYGAITDIAARREGRPCRRCGGVYWRPAGLRVCRHTAEAMVELQAARLDRWLAAGVTDVWAALDDCDAAELRIARRGGSALQRDLVAVGRATLFWLVTIRCEDLHIGLQRLRLISNDLPDPSRNRPALSHRIPYFSPLTLRFAHVNPHNFS